MVTTTVAVYRLTPQQPRPTPSETPPASDELSVADEQPVADSLPVVDGLSSADELPPSPQPVTAAPNATQRVSTKQRATPAPPLVSTTPMPQFVTAAPNVTSQQPAAPSPLPAPPLITVPLAVATSSATRADLAAPELGTLVAVAVGGACEFSVDGQSITTSAALRLKLPPGPHVVECGLRTRSVTVRRGETSMALFKL